MGFIERQGMASFGSSWFIGPEDFALPVSGIFWYGNASGAICGINLKEEPPALHWTDTL